MSQSFLLIPDISGFTNFVKNTEKKHSIHIVSELLETIIDANILDLELAEIEGDAVFYYKEDYVPNYEDLLKQVKKMYLAFHTYLRAYETRRICPCGACETAINLALKFVSHIGELDFIQVKQIKKPFGESVIQIHRILKNSVDADEYLLTSNLLWKSLGNQDEDKIWSSGKDHFDSEDFEYKFMTLDDWKLEVEKIDTKELFDIKPD